METNNQGSSNAFLWIVVIIILIVVGYFIWPKGEETAIVTETPSPSVSTQPVTTNEPITNQPIINRMHTITIETNKGTIILETYDADAPKAVNNFILGKFTTHDSAEMQAMSKRVSQALEVVLTEGAMKAMNQSNQG